MGGDGGRERIYEEMRGVAKRVNRRVIDALEPLKAEHEGLYDVVVYLPRIKVGDRYNASMVRPTLVMLGYEAAGGVDLDRAVPVAVAVELLNISTYVIDDIFDDCTVRHSMPAVHVKFGVNDAVIAGFLLRELASKTLKQANLGVALTTALQDLLCHTHYVIYTGQYHDLRLNTTRAVTVDEYLVRTRKITGTFIQSCIVLGAMTAGANEDSLEPFRTFGHHYGLAVQLRNDLMDFVIPDERFESAKGFKGETHVDFREGKRTLPVIHCLAHATPAQRDRLLSLLGNKKASKEELLEANDIMNATESFEFTCSQILASRAQALDAAALLPPNRAGLALRELAAILDNVESWQFTMVTEPPASVR
jgi:geranylgeranyl pyrophosphate synthase